MSKFRTGLRVVVIGENHEIRKGTVKSVCEEIGVAIVSTDDGNVEKVHFSRMDIEPETKAQENQAVKTESQEGVKVITKDQFIEAVHYVTSPEGMLGDKAGEVDPMNVMITGMSVFIVGMHISEKLFQDKEEIAITKDQLKEIIIENSNPDEIAKTTDGKMSVFQVLPISMLSMLVLHKLITILFDDSEND